MAEIKKKIIYLRHIWGQGSTLGDGKEHTIKQNIQIYPLCIMKIQALDFVSKFFFQRRQPTDK